MSTCEYRRGRIDGIPSRPAPQPVCQIFEFEGASDPSCVLPGMSTLECPIAKLALGGITAEQAGLELRLLQNVVKQAAAPRVIKVAIRVGQKPQG